MQEMGGKKIRLNCKFIGFKNGRLNYKCKESKKSYTKLIDEAIKDFPTLYKFCNCDLDKFFLLLRKGIYPYEYIDSRKLFNESTIPPKEAFYSELNLEGIIDADYEHFKKVLGAFEIKNLAEYHHLYFQCDTLLLPDVFKNFRDKCIEIYGFDPVHFMTAPGLPWQACLKKDKSRIRIINKY